MPLLETKGRKESVVKNNYSIAERNHIVEENLPTIDKVIRRNWRLMVTLRTTIQTGGRSAIISGRSSNMNC